MSDQKAFLYQLLKPIFRICIRRDILMQEFNEIAKQAAIDAAQEELRSQGSKVTVSAISLRTGLRRKEVDRIYKKGELKEIPPSIPTRVVGNWVQYDEFRKKSGGGRILRFEGEDSEFWQLIRTVSSDIHPGIVLRELEAAGVVERTSRGIKLLKEHYDTRSDSDAAYRLLSRDVENLIESVHENIEGASESPNLHGTTFFTNIEPQDLEKIENWVVDQGTKFHKKVRSYISGFRRDLSPESETWGSGITLYLTTFTRAIVPASSDDDDDE